MVYSIQLELVAMELVFPADYSEGPRLQSEDCNQSADIRL